MLAAASPAVPQSASRPAARRALIVIDVQNEYVTGNLPIEYPPLDVSLANIGRAIDAAHAAGVPVIVVQHVAPAGAPIFAPGTDGVALHTVVTSRPYAHLIEKAQASSFAGTDLAAWLDAHGIDTLAVTGYMTHNCNASTVYHAAHAGLKVEYLNDATGALPYENEAGGGERRRDSPHVRGGVPVEFRGGDVDRRVDRGARRRTDAGARFGRRVEPAGPRAAREGGLTRHGDAARDAPCRQSRSFSIAGL